LGYRQGLAFSLLTMLDFSQSTEHEV
jgi:hypothetical protein